MAPTREKREVTKLKCLGDRLLLREYHTTCITAGFASPVLFRLKEQCLATHADFLLASTSVRRVGKKRVTKPLEGCLGSAVCVLFFVACRKEEGDKAAD